MSLTLTLGLKMWGLIGLGVALVGPEGLVRIERALGVVDVNRPVVGRSTRLVRVQRLVLRRFNRTVLGVLEGARVVCDLRISHV